MKEEGKKCYHCHLYEEGENCEKNMSENWVKRKNKTKRGIAMWHYKNSHS